jgi:hypothetical protein
MVGPLDNSFYSGGKAKTVVIPGENDKPSRKLTILQDDQDVEGKDCRVSTLVHAARHKRPIVLIAGREYKQLPWSLGNAAYAVLGW